MVTDSSGNKVEGIAYYPYGQTRTDSGSVSVKHKYTGQELDSSTGLYFYNARYYDPSLGRFISADSIIPDPSDPQSFNRYSYVRNNPINLTDPSGHSWLSDATGIDIKMSKDQQAGLVILATAAATWYCGGCGAAGFLQGALAGEIGGGVGAYATGGDVLQGVVVGGAIGGGIGYFTGPLVNPQYSQVADLSLKIAGKTIYTISSDTAANIGLAGGGAYIVGNMFGLFDGGNDHGNGGGGGGSSISADRGNSYYTPTAPQFVDVHQNMIEAEKHYGNMSWFYNQVRNKGPWDYKQAGRLYGKFGNFNYGATGRSLGVPADVLLRGAGWAHQQAGNMGSGGNWWGSAPYGDDEKDQLMIMQGIKYYDLWQGLR